MTVKKNEVRDYLIATARTGSVIYYSELNEHFGLPIWPSKRNPITSILGQLMYDNASKGLPLLPSVVVGKQKDKPRMELVPQPGYFKTLCGIREHPLPIKIADKRKIHRAERDLVFAYYAAKRE